MALEKTVVIDLIEVLPEYKAVQVREATIIADGVDSEGNPVVVAKNNRRWVIGPDDDYSQEDDKVKAAVAAVRNPDLVAAYLATL